MLFYTLYEQFYFEFLGIGLRLLDGLYYTNSLSHLSHMFILILIGLILQLNGFYSLKVCSVKYSPFYRLVVFRSRCFIYNNHHTITYIKLVWVALHLLFLLVSIIYTNDFFSQYVLEMQTGSDSSELGDSDLSRYKPLPPIYDDQIKDWVPNPGNYFYTLEVTTADSTTSKDHLDDLEIYEEDNKLKIEGYKSLEAKSFEGSSAKVSRDGYDVTITKDSLKLEKDGKIIQDLNGKAELNADKDIIYGTCGNKKVTIDFYQDTRYNQ